MNKLRFNKKLTFAFSVFVMSVTILVVQLRIVGSVMAVTNPQNGSIGLEGTINAPPPTQAATITTPDNGQNFTTSPITVSGICPAGLLIKIYDNNIFSGSTECTNSSYVLKISLFNGSNSLVASDYDNLNQQGPNSNTVNVSYASAQFTSFGVQLTLSSNYSQLGADPGQLLSWPITINGGTSPYALSIDWGDGTADTLMSAATAGQQTLTHTYQLSGTYTVTVQATDKNGQPAFLQIVSVIAGPVQKLSSSQSTKTPTSTTQTSVISLWAKIALIVLLILMVATFWIGRRYELNAIRRKIEKSNNA